ncbi:MAG: LOG family protein [Candidatus Neomarinimicrobiota bacterium]|nr:LOG family protein [Candidatus Neomarinimicrobiota bacterium]
MNTKEKKVRRFLSKQIQQLNNIVADLDTAITDMGTEFYRVSIFGSARIKPDTKEYKGVYTLAKELAENGADIVTGGGPGLMEAANAGAKEGSSSKSKSFGIRIDLPFEATPNEHLDIKFYHKRFSSRLDEFMRISHAVVVTPGGIGTLLELLYTWQLIQVNHISARPIILVGDMWNGFFDWIKSEPLKAQLLDKSDFDNIVIVKNVHEVTKLLKPEIKAFYVKKFESKS